MTTTHKLRVFLQVGDSDIGAEQECELAFTYLPGGKATRDDPGWAPEIGFVSAAPLCNGKPAPFLDYIVFQQDSLNELAAAWLESDEGQAAAMAEVDAEAEDARAFIAELRKEAP